jgi:hypothetical protein
VSISFLQSTSKNAGAVTSTTLAFGSNVTSGSALISGQRWSDNTITCTVSDNVNAGNYANDQTTQFASGAMTCQISSKLNAGAGATTVTFTMSGSVNTQVAIDEVSGIVTSSALDQHTGATGNSTAPASGATGTTTQASEFVYGVLGAGAGYSGTITADTAGGWTDDQAAPVGSSARLHTEYRIASSTGTFNADGTMSVAANWTAVVATYKGSSAAPQPQPFINTALLAAIRAQWLPDDWPAQRGPVIASLNSLTLALTGIRVSSVAGTIAPSVTLAVTGSAAAFSAGTLPPQISLSLTGSGATFTAGILSPAIAVALAGIPITSASGSLAEATTLALTGSEAIFTAGAVTANVNQNVTVALTGQAATFTAGLISAQGQGASPGYRRRFTRYT